MAVLVNNNRKEKEDPLAKVAQIASIGANVAALSSKVGSSAIERRMDDIKPVDDIAAGATSHDVKAVTQDAYEPTLKRIVKNKYPFAGA